MDADAVAKEWLSGWFSNGAHDEMVKALGVAFRFYAASRLRAAAETVFQARGYEDRCRHFTAASVMVAKLAAAEERG
jgi:hypothetical protein